VSPLNSSDSHEVKVELEYVPTTEYMFFKEIARSAGVDAAFHPLRHRGRSGHDPGAIRRGRAHDRF
jgi:hypothetical protein